MALTQAPFVLGSHAFFFREGDAFTLPSAGTAGRTAKPGATDTGWIDLGIIEEQNTERESEDITVFAPTPGRLRKYDIIEVKDAMKVTFTGAELGPVAIEILYKTLALTSASTQFNPLEGQTKKGWLKIQQYDQNDAQRLVLDVFGRLKVTGGIKAGGGELAKVQYEFEVLHSTLNTGTL